MYLLPGVLAEGLADVLLSPEPKWLEPAPAGFLSLLNFGFSPQRVVQLLPCVSGFSFLAVTVSTSRTSLTASAKVAMESSSSPLASAYRHQCRAHLAPHSFRHLLHFLLQQPLVHQEPHH